MNGEFFKAPSLSVWALFVIGGVAVAAIYLGAPFDTLLVCLVLISGIWAFGIVCRWSGRWLGWGVARVTQGFVTGFKEGLVDGRAKARGSKRR